MSYFLLYFLGGLGDNNKSAICNAKRKKKKEKEEKAH